MSECVALSFSTLLPLALLPALMTFLGPLYVGSFSCESGSSSPSEFMEAMRVILALGVSGFFSSGSSVFFYGLFFWAIKKQSAEREGSWRERRKKGGGGEGKR